jgi:hypothetical protein
MAHHTKPFSDTSLHCSCRRGSILRRKARLRVGEARDSDAGPLKEKVRLGVLFGRIGPLDEPGALDALGCASGPAESLTVEGQRSQCHLHSPAKKHRLAVLPLPTRAPHHSSTHDSVDVRASSGRRAARLPLAVRGPTVEMVARLIFSSTVAHGNRSRS